MPKPKWHVEVDRGELRVAHERVGAQIRLQAHECGRVVSGMLSLAKSVEMAGEFALLRKCVEDVAYRKMVVYRGVGDDDDRLYRQMALKVLIPNSRGSNLKRAMFLSMLPNGNWRNIHAVEIFLPFGQLVVDVEEFKRDVARGVARCLCSKNYRVRHQPM